MNKFCKEIIYFLKQSRCDRREWGILIWIVGTTYKEGHAQLQSTLQPFNVVLSTAFPVTHIQCKMHHVYWLCTFTTELWNKRVAIVIFSIEDQPALSSSWTAVRIGRMNEWMNGLLLWWGLSICRGECLSVWWRDALFVVWTSGCCRCCCFLSPMPPVQYIIFNSWHIITSFTNCCWGDGQWSHVKARREWVVRERSSV